MQYKRQKKVCEYCNRSISLSNFSRHTCNSELHISKTETFFAKIGEKYQCPECKKLCHKKGINYHFWKMHTVEGRCFITKPKFKDRVIWNKGKTKQTDIRIKKIAETLSKTTKGKKGHPHTEQSKLNLSKGMKKAHAEGRAWNIGKNRSKNKPSWPEQFFMKVIENEFYDKNYIREYPCTIYSIDFAWPDKKKAIELDGAQHYRFKEYAERDIRKNKVLELNGWLLLRIKWDEMFKDTKKWIKIANEFVGE